MPTNTEKIEAGANVKIVKANVLSVNEVEEAVNGNEVVISTYNPGWTNPDLYNEFLNGAKAIQEGVKKAGVKRLIFVGGGGSLFIADGVQLVDTDAFPAEWKPGALAARDYLNHLKSEDKLECTRALQVKEKVNTEQVLKIPYMIVMEEV